MTASPGPPPPPPAGFDDLLAGFLAGLLDREAPQLPAAPLADWPAVTAALVAGAGPAARQRRLDREQRLTETLAATAPQVAVESLPAFAGERISIAPVTDLPSAAAAEPCYLKINHGFWEQLYAIFGPTDSARMRVRDPQRFRVQYVDSWFVDALAAAIGLVARPEAARLVFPGIHFGASLASGTHDHPEVLAGFAAREPRERKIVIGAAIGLVAWWESIFPGLQPAFSDGSFPKRGLADGRLRETLARAAADSARIVFVVPPHLRGVRLTDVGLPQETIPVPAETVHESWAACLAATSRHLLGRLAEDGSLLVITQSAVFSALLGCFLVEARRRLLPAGSRLRFFDLGQVLDVAAPEAGGRWTRLFARGDTGLFTLDPAARNPPC